MSDRDAILQRRRRLIALALAGATTGACSTATACLRVAHDADFTDAGVTEDAPEDQDGGTDE